MIRGSMLAVIGAVLGGLAGSVCAHEFWLAPSTLVPTPGEAFAIRLMHGERFSGDVVNVPSRFERFEIVGLENQARDELVQLGEIRAPAGRRSSYAKVEASDSSASRGSVLVYESDWVSSVLPPQQFEAYLQEEGLDLIAAERERSGETGAPGHERYKRCAKALLDAVQGGVRASASEDVGDQDWYTGLPLEIVVRSRREGTVRAIVLRGGQPLEGLGIVLARQDDPSDLREAMTDEHGMVEFGNVEAGRAMLTTICMERVRDTGLTRDAHAAEWQSFWASSVFRVSGKN